MTLIILAGILAVLLLLVGGRRGLRTILTLTLNLGVFFAMTGLILKGMGPVPAAVLACIVICIVSLFFNCGFNAKSVASFLSVVFVVLALWALVQGIGRGAHIEGFSSQQREQIEAYTWIINIDMGDLAVACILIGFSGAIIDTAIAVSSAQYEVAHNNPRMQIAGLYRSGIRVGRDVLGTTCNTLFFAFLGGHATLIIWYAYVGWSIPEIVNSEIFMETFLRSASSALGCVLIMPVTSLITAVLLRSRANAVIRDLERRLHDWKRRHHLPYLERR
ncbi:MAG: YibE/F family protein [Oscillospiraceae bacterium]|nr:YibE/F family protein [Oscillospiraceae bacterium]